MQPKKGSGANGWVIFLAVVGGLFLAGKLLPIVSTLLSVLMVVGIVLLVLAIVLVLYFAFKPDDNKPGQVGPGKNGGNQTFGQNGPNQGNNYNPNGGTNYGQGSGTAPNQGGYNQNGNHGSYGGNGQNRPNDGRNSNYGNNSGYNGYNPNGGNRGGYNGNGQNRGNGYNPGTNYRQGPGSGPNTGTNYRRGNPDPNSYKSNTAGRQNGRPNIFDANPNGNHGPKGNDPGEKQKQQAIPPCDLSPEAMQIMTKGRNHLKELRRLLSRIGNLNVKKRGEDICVEVERILGALQQQPEDIPMVRQFFNYYLPTLGNILLKYLRLEEAGMATEQTTVKVMSCLGEIKVAMEKQYAAIFENDILDLTVEMESLTQAVKRDGLLVSDDFTIREGEREITLTI